MSSITMMGIEPRVRGRLDLLFENQGSQTVMKVRGQEQPLKVVRAFELPGGGALVHLHNLSGGVLGGDKLEVRVKVEAGATAQLTSTSATRLYRSGPDGQASGQLNDFAVGEGGLLEYLPDQLIPFAGARYRQQTRIEMGEGAGLFWWETVAPGREARGEVFDYDLLELNVALTRSGRPIATEKVLLEPKTRPLTSIARLGHFRYFSTFYMVKVGLDKATWTRLENSLNDRAAELSVPGETLWGASCLWNDGVVVRAVSRNGRAITRGLLEMWKLGKQELYGQQAVLPRKIY